EPQIGSDLGPRMTISLHYRCSARSDLKNLPRVLPRDCSKPSSFREQECFC
ncbi:unnamed protein product, partial [Arabidopsis halleri]